MIMFINGYHRNQKLCVEWDVKPYTLIPLVLRAEILLDVFFSNSSVQRKCTGVSYVVINVRIIVGFICCVNQVMVFNNTVHF